MREPLSVKLTRCDALYGLRRLAPASVDAVIADPPYCSGGMVRGDRMQSTTAKYVQSGQAAVYRNFTGDTRDQRGFAFWGTLWLSECLRVTKPGGACAVFIDWRQLPTLTDALQAAGWVWRGIAPWDKTERCRPQMGRPRQQAEYLVYATNGPQSSTLAKSIGVIPGVCREPVTRADKFHITGKPTRVMEWAVRLCPRGGTVLDPFTGSGTTAVACVTSWRNFVGFEIDAHYHSEATRRIAEARRRARRAA
jgi:site-specific DNA-methyltransferase (adenine-specific)